MIQALIVIVTAIDLQILPIRSPAGSECVSLISTFIDLNEDQSLQALDTGNSRVFADTMTFTTTLSGSVAPHVEIAPVGNKWGLASPTSFAAFGQRLDKHMVIVGLSMEVPKATAVAQAP